MKGECKLWTSQILTCSGVKLYNLSSPNLLCSPITAFSSFKQCISSFVSKLHVRMAPSSDALRTYGPYGKTDNDVTSWVWPTNMQSSFHELFQTLIEPSFPLVTKNYKKTQIYLLTHNDPIPDKKRKKLT